MTMGELRRSVDTAWSDGDFKLAARHILSSPIIDGRAGPAPFWIDWANDVITGRIKPIKTERPDIPLLKNGDLFGEPLTNGGRLKRR